MKKQTLATGGSAHGAGGSAAARACMRSGGPAGITPGGMARAAVPDRPEDIPQGM